LFALKRGVTLSTLIEQALKLIMSREPADDGR